MRSIREALFASVVMFCHPVAHAAAQESSDAVDCLSLGRVRDIEVVDDGCILFYQGRQLVYLNVIESTCDGLIRDVAFGWRNGRGTARSPRLCRANFISVIDWGRIGSACKLGAFQ